MYRCLFHDSREKYPFCPRVKNSIRVFVFITFFLTGLSLCMAQTPGTFIDQRDGQKYKTVTVSVKDSLNYSSTTWMAENLNYEMDGSWAYDDKKSNRKVYGLLYTWDAATVSCPDGWHLPGDVEWQSLVDRFGGEEISGESLKSRKGWDEAGNGTNSSKFNALPGGYRKYDGIYEYSGYSGHWWSSGEGNGHGFYREMYCDNISARRSASDKPLGFSVRCVMHEQM